MSATIDPASVNGRCAGDGWTLKSDLNGRSIKHTVVPIIWIEDVLISGFGKFCVKAKKERTGRNPETGKELILRARRVVVFQCSGILRKKINR